MNKREFLKTAGLAGVAVLMPSININASKPEEGCQGVGGCVLIPTETAGPFPLDLTENTFYFRQDVREDRTGAQFNLRMKIIGSENCLPLQNVRVNIWHCSKDGLYSGYDSGLNAGQEGLTYLRGYQMTDVNGELEFITIYPGFYPGRICHIHFQVLVSSSFAVVSQMTFEPSITNAIYAAHTELYTNGPDPMTLATDGAFVDGYAQQLVEVTENPETGGYNGYLEVTVQGSGTLGIGHLERQTAKYLNLDQNFPNPFIDLTTIPCSITERSKVQLELWDLSGKRIAVPFTKELSAGEYQIPLDMVKLGLRSANLVYQMEVTNSQGTFRTSKMMSAVK